MVVRNQSVGTETVWVENEMTFTEIIRQEYADCAFSAGVVEGHTVDTVYIQLSRDGDVTQILLRPDEMAAIAWLASGVLWSNLVVQGGIQC